MPILPAQKYFVSMASLIAVTSMTSMMAGPVRAHAKSPDPQTRTETHSICLATTAHSVTPRGQTEGIFVGYLINGVNDFAEARGSCADVDPNGECAKGYVKLTSASPVICHPPVGL